MKKLMYIIMFLLIAANVAAQGTYVIDMVCVGADRYYRINGEKGSTYEWYIKDTLGNEIAKPTNIDFWVENSNGDTTRGSEISVIWSNVGMFNLSTLHYSSHGCDTVEQGWVEVYEPPGADAGPDLMVCVNEAAVLSTDTAWSFSSLLWTSAGDGTFSDGSQLHPAYFPGKADSIAGKVVLIITASERIKNTTCKPAIDSMEIRFSNPSVILSSAGLLCYNDSTGWAKTTVTGGIEPYKYTWTGPGTFTSYGDSVFGLAPGIYIVTVTDSIGCMVIDSVEITEPLELLATIFADVQQICDDDTIHLKANPQGGTGNYTHLWSGNGAVYLNDTGSLTPYFNGAVAGLYTLIYSVTDENGCVAMDTMDLTILPKDTITFDTIICIKEAPFAWYGKNYFATGIYTDTLSQANGCDTILILDLTVMPKDTITFDTTICGTEAPFAWYGKDYFKTDVYIDTLPALIGCDTILILNLTVLPVDTISLDTVICGMDAPFAWYGKSYYTTGVYTSTFTPPVGCDTILILDLTVLPIDTVKFDKIVCGVDVPYAWYGKNYLTTGIYIDTLASAAGCDTLAILDLTVLPIDTVTFDTIICISETPFAWYGKNYFATGFYTDTLTPAVGCDTILILDLTVMPKDTIIFDTTICGTEAPFAWYGKDYFKTDVYIDTLPALIGCDTILILNLTVLPVDTISLDTVICGMDAPFAWYGKNYYTTGVYTSTFTPPVGCDTILILDLTVLPIDTVKFDMVICGIEAPYTWYGKNYMTTGIYIDTLVSAVGCDTVLMLDLTVLPIDTLTFDTLICISQTPFAWYGKDYFTSGIYTDTLVSAVGCDTVLMLDLTVLPIDTITFDKVICVSEAPFTWYGKNYFTTGIYTDTLAAKVGCDTILILDLTVLPVDTVAFDTIICGIRAPFAWYGKNYFTTGIYTDTLAAKAGCDTILILDLTVLPIDTISFDTVICATEGPFTWYGKDYFATDIYTDTLISATGCDTVLILDLTVLPGDTISFDTVICVTEAPFTWYGKDYMTTGIYREILFNASGCDTVVILDLTVMPKITFTLDKTICESTVPFTWFGKDYYVDGLYHDTLLNASGCDTVLMLDLKVLPEISISLGKTICAGEAPFTWFGKDYFTTGIYNDTIFSITGCDTLLALDLKVAPEFLVTRKLTIYESELPYTWFNEIFNQADTLIQTLPSATGGCDTIRRLELLVIPGILAKGQLTICEDELPYIWFGQTFTQADTVIIKIPSTTGGSDTIRTLELQTVPVRIVAISIAADKEIICSGKMVAFTATPVNEGTSPKYTWYVNGKVVPGETSEIFTYIPRNGDVVFATLESNLACVTGNPAISKKITIATSNNITPAIAGIGPFCLNSVAPQLPLVSLNGITGTWSPSQITTSLARNRTFTFTPDTGQCTFPVQIDIEVLPVVKPVFAPIGPLCQNSAAPLLPPVSTNGIKGTWNPAIIETGFDGTFTYTFTPDSGQCAVPVPIIIEITPEITPSFVPPGPLCQNSAAPVLPSVSTNGITGTWNPAIIGTKNVGTFTFIFTPTAGQCAKPVNITVVITPEITPVFLQIGPLCQNSIAPLLPSVSINGITGTWSPTIINTAVIGTGNYTFTPNPNQCAVNTTISIEITDKIKPLFSAPGPLCRNSAAPLLPAVSTNGINGTWNPSAIETKNEGTFTYIFTPAPGQCAVPATMNIVITPEITPVFVQVGQLCQNSIAPLLPLVSSNGITGTWNPAIISTSVVGTTAYNFTPDAGQCAVPVTMNIEITDKIKPLFAAIGPFCQNGVAPALPLVSENGTTGTWNPATIETSATGMFTFTFTPAAGQCAVPVIIDIEITDKITPVFLQPGPFCQNSAAPALPLVSQNGITGTWNPATIKTSATGMFTCTFTPDAGQCAVPVTMDIEITDEITPVFLQPGPFCLNSVAPALPLVSENGITGTWNPATIKTSAKGTFTYTFTPAAGQCAVKTIIGIEISDTIPPVAICHNLTVYLDADGKASITTAQINNGSTDNCKLDTLFLSRYDFGCADVGKNPVTLTAVDAVGLSGFCVATVTVLDTIKPVVICRGPFEIQLDKNAEYKLTVGEILVDASDACGIDTMYIYPQELDCDHIGLTTIRLWAVSVNGDSAYCETQVTIYGNRPPKVMNDSTTTIENIPVVIDVVENDYDEKSRIVISSLAISVKPRHGIVSINLENGELSYMPNRNFSGVDVLKYRIYDDGIPCGPEFGEAYVYITVIPVNDKPLAVDDYYDAGCFSVSGNVLDNDRDPDSDNRQINTDPLTPPNHGTLIIDPDGTISYFPNQGFIGIDSFEYVICDYGSPSLCDTAKVYINVDCSEESRDPVACELFVPEGFSPNEDGVHDFFRIMCIHNYPDAKLMIFNRNGNLLWQKENYGNYIVWGDQYNAWWWGTSVLNKYDIGRQMINGEPKLKVGNYVYLLQLGNGVVKNGTVLIAY